MVYVMSGKKISGSNVTRLRHAERNCKSKTFVFQF